MIIEIPKRKPGRTGVEITILGLGGEWVLRTFGYNRDRIDFENIFPSERRSI